MSSESIQEESKQVYDNKDEVIKISIEPVTNIPDTNDQNPNMNEEAKQVRFHDDEGKQLNAREASEGIEESVQHTNTNKEEGKQDGEIDPKDSNQIDSDKVFVKQLEEEDGEQENAGKTEKGVSQTNDKNEVPSQKSVNKEQKELNRPNAGNVNEVAACSTELKHLGDQIAGKKKSTCYPMKLAAEKCFTRLQKLQEAPLMKMNKGFLIASLVQC